MSTTDSRQEAGMNCNDNSPIMMKEEEDVEPYSSSSSSACSISNKESTAKNPNSGIIDFQQLAILMVGLICMGAALGFERSLLPRMAVEVFHIRSSTTVLNLVSTFGASKAIANVFAGPLADRFGRKPALVSGFLFGLPVMPYVCIAKSWSGITAMNVAFGFSQGLLGSSLFFLLIDVMGPKRRGIAVGLGECTIYVSTAILNVCAGWLASKYGYRPVPFIVASSFGVVGLLSTYPLRDTLDKVQAEQNEQQQKQHTSRIQQQQDDDDDDIEKSNNNISMENRLLHLKSQGGVHATANIDDEDLGKNQQYNMEFYAQGYGEDTTSITSTIDDTSNVDTLYRKETLAPSEILLKHPATPPKDKKMEDFEASVDLSYRMYASMEDSDYEDDDDDDDESEKEKNDDKKWEKVDEVISSMTKIPSTLQLMAKQISGVKCNNKRRRKTSIISGFDPSDINIDFTDNEESPLVAAPTRFSSYGEFAYDDESDESDVEPDETEIRKVEHLDELEHDVKTMYPSAFHILFGILWENRNYGLLCIAGMAMNFKDGFAWGSFPLFFAKFHNLSDEHTDMLVAIYPLCWGCAQAFTGALSDIYGRSLFLLCGFGACTIGTALFFVPGFIWGRPADDNPQHILVWIIADVFLGFGTAFAYPALQAAVADEVPPVYRGLGLGFYRFIRDMGYVVGALICGNLTDMLGYPITFLIVSGVLCVSFMFILFFYKPL